MDLGIDPPSFDFSMEYPTATLRDVVKPQNPVMISSDIPRRIIHPKRGMRAGLFFTPIHVKDFETELTLTSKVKLPFTYLLDTVRDFLIKLGMKPRMYLAEISIFLLYNVTVRPTKIMNRANKNWAYFQKIYIILKILIWSPSPIFFTEFFWKDSTNFNTEK